MPISGDYFEELKKRAKQSKVYQSFQLTGLEISQLLGDEKHKALYIKLAKTRDPEELRRLAKTIADNPNVQNKGAYFMSCLKREGNSPTKQ